jgi:hypothetical protein
MYGLDIYYFRDSGEHRHPHSNALQNKLKPCFVARFNYNIINCLAYYNRVAFTPVKNFPHHFINFSIYYVNMEIASA